MLAGAMAAKRVSSYFRRQHNKVVVDRRASRPISSWRPWRPRRGCSGPDSATFIQPGCADTVAEELHVPILLTNKDTLSTTEIVESFFGRSRFQQAQKVQRFTSLLEEHFDFSALYVALNLKKA